MINYQDTLLSCALAYAARGFHVFPTHTIKDGDCSCEEVTCGSRGKHPRVSKWQERGTTSERTLRQWWQHQFPGANIAIVTGEQSGCFVVDVDGPLGIATLNGLERYGPFPKTLTANTGRGQHIYFRHPGSPVKTGAGCLGEGVDVRGDGGYVVAPPSRHHSGRVYSWEDAEMPIAEAPGWLVELLTHGKELAEEEGTNAPVAPDWDGQWIPEGTRNETLFKIGCSLRARGAEKDEIEGTLMNINTERCEPPLPASEITSIAQSAVRYEAGSPPNPTTQKKNHLWWFAFDVSGWNADTRISLLKDYQVGWLIRLMVLAWMNHGYLPNDPTNLAKLAGAGSAKKFKNEVATVLQFFEPTEDETRIYHPELLELWKEKLDLVERNKENARLRGQKAKEKVA
jgi:putative DNA primase/helicase